MKQKFFDHVVEGLLSLFVLMLFGFTASAQNISGQANVCAGQPYYYYANPAGGNHKLWAVFNGTIVSGTKYDDEIQVVWAAGAPYADISWIAYPGGDGGSKEIFVTTPAAPSSLAVDCILGTNTVEADASTVEGSSQYHWTITGFGLSSSYTTTTTGPSLATQVPDTNVPGTVCVKAYFSVCGSYGSQTCKSYP